MVEKFFQHIEKVLAQHDYVVVPNLGGFVLQTKSSVLFSDRITPPLDTISFNPLMHHAVGLLAIEIAKTEGLSFRMSVELIDIEVEKIKTKLKSNGNVQFGNLGFLQQSETGNIQFTPIEKAEFLPQNFGLTDIYVTARDIQKHHESRKVTFTLPSTRIYKYAAAGMLIFGLLFVTPKVNDMRQTETANIASISIVNRNVISTEKKTSLAAAIQTTDSVSNNTNLLELENYHVIVASLQSQKTADNFCKVLTDANFTHARVLPPSKIYRIAIQSFTNKDEAIRYMENLRKTDKRFETAWVLCN